MVCKFDCRAAATLTIDREMREAHLWKMLWGLTSWNTLVKSAVFASVLSWQVGDLVSDLVIYPVRVQHLSMQHVHGITPAGRACHHASMPPGRPRARGSLAPAPQHLSGRLRAHGSHRECVGRGIR